VEVRYLKAIQTVSRGTLSIAQAAKSLGFRRMQVHKLPQSYGGIGAAGLATKERRSAHLPASKRDLRDPVIKAGHLWTLHKGSTPVNSRVYFILLQSYYPIDIKECLVRRDNVLRQKVILIGRRK
jgi:hypothetical protein